MQGLKHLFGYDVRATDGSIGKVEDFFVEEASWTARYLVVRTGGFLSGERAVVPISCVKAPDADRRSIGVTFEKARLKDVVASDDVRPVSAEMEEMLKAVYGGSDVRRDRGFIRVGCPTASSPGGGVSSLRSVREITGYQIETLEGPCGCCTDLLADPEDWSVPYLVVNTKEWMPHGHVLLPTAWAGHISWQDMQIEIDAHRAKVQKAQRFDPASHDVWRGTSKALNQSAAS